MVEIRIDGNDFGVGDGGQVDGLRGVQTTGVDQQLQRLQSNRRILTFCAGKPKVKHHLNLLYLKRKKIFNCLNRSIKS